MTGFEPAASCSQSRRATNCATPGYFVILFGWSYSPKCRALPVEPHPDIQFLPLYHGGEENQRFFCLWSFLWSKPLLCRFRQSVQIPQTQASKGFAAFRLALSRIPPRHSQTVCVNLAYYTSFLRVLQEGETLRMGGICRTTIHIEQEYNTRHGLQAIQ